MKKIFTYKKNKISKSSSIDELYKEYQNRMFGKAKDLRSKGISKTVNLMRKDRFEEKYLKGIDENEATNKLNNINKYIDSTVNSLVIENKEAASKLYC